MIDIHCHILPGIDDGAVTEANSLAMAREAVQQGIHTIIATPHHKNGKYDNTKGSIKKSVEVLSELLVTEDVPLTLLAGQEIRINGDMIDDIEKDELLSLNSSKYMFVEFPSGSVPEYAKQMFFDIQVAGYTPIIVHPERNAELMQNPDKLYEFIRKGALTQITAASLIGKFGKNIQKFSRQLVDTNLTHFLASDAHNITTRGFCMKDAYQELRNEFGNDMFYLFMENCQLLTDNQNVNKMEPEMIRKKKFMGVF